MPQPTARNRTRAVTVGSIAIGGDSPIVVQSMCATKTTDVAATVAQANALAAAGAGVVRIAVDTRAEVEALAAIRRETVANLSVDLQENFRLAAAVAPWVDKIRYNPGHLYHSEPEQPWQDKVRFLADVAVRHDCALRVGVNCGSVDPAMREKFPTADSVGPMVASALTHCELLESLGFVRYCVSLKDSDPAKVIDANIRFAAQRPEVPLHLGVTEAGMPPEGIVRTRTALEPLLLRGIGDTIRVSLTLPNARKHEEVEAGRQILDDLESVGDVKKGQMGELDSMDGRPGMESPVFPSSPYPLPLRLIIVSCPSCSRVENAAFVDLAYRVRELTAYASHLPITIAVMGCRVNGPGETDHADLGLWCGPRCVNLKRGTQTLGSFPYDEILARLKQELDRLISAMGSRPDGSDQGFSA